MASPAAESFCCLSRMVVDWTPTINTNESLLELDSHKSFKASFEVYNFVCSFSSALSILGAIYQLWPRQPQNIPRSRRETESLIRQNIIICWLAMADLLASSGIFVRSVLWLSGYRPATTYNHHDSAFFMMADNMTTIGPTTEPVPDLNHILCAVLSGWVQFFYICTYLWTFCYALDVYRFVHDLPVSTCLYHILGWIVPAALTGAGVVSLYYPNLTVCAENLTHIVPHFLSSYIPILCVLVVNPILYTYSSRKVHATLLSRGRFTDQERSMLTGIKEKFILITFIFYLCWLPNIINGIVLAIIHRKPSPYMFILWIFMAVVNPLQGFLNALVYRGIGGCNLHLPDRIRNFTRSSDNYDYSSFEDSTERSALLGFRRS